MTNVVKSGDTVTIHYKGTFNDGTEFDSSYTKGEPMTVTVGSGQLISGFDDALNGMEEGETKSISLGPDEAYGDVDPERFTELETSVFPDDFEFEKSITHTNRTLSDIETVFLLTSSNVSFISSSIVREVIKNNGNYKHFVPKAVNLKK